MNNKDTQYFDKEILIKIRTALNLTQDELAKRIGVSRGCISAIEIGRNKLYDKLLEKIYSTFNIDPDSFQNGNDLLFLNNSPIENCLITDYHLSKQNAETLSQLLDSYICLTSKEQEFINPILNRILEINKYIKENREK